MFLLYIKTRVRGSVLVEFAILLPVFILLIMGTVESGWALYIQNTLVDAARYGTRLAVTQQGQTTDGITNLIKDYATANNLPETDIHVDINPVAFASANRGDPITITVSIDYAAVSILPTPLFFGGVTLKANVTMVKEY